MYTSRTLRECTEERTIVLEKHKRQIAMLHDSLHTLKVAGSLHPMEAHHAGDPAQSLCPSASLWTLAEVASQPFYSISSSLLVFKDRNPPHAFCPHKASAVQQKYTQAERGHAALDEELTRGYIHNLEVHASQQERVGHYRKNEQAKRDKVSIVRSGRYELVQAA